MVPSANKPLKDSQGLEVTTETPEALAAINEATEILFRKKSGLDTLLPSAADKYPDCPLLQLYTLVSFFLPFSAKLIRDTFPIYLARITPEALNEREGLHYQALLDLHRIDFHAAIPQYEQILTKYPEDKVALFMLETICLMAGAMPPLLACYSSLYPRYSDDPDFLGMLAFLYAHLDRQVEARTLVEKALGLAPHNAWVQHVYAHTLDETEPAQIEEGIVFLEKCTADWPRQNRFFEGHNWMHLCGLYSKQKREPAGIFEVYSHIWGQAKPFNFEQNNAFLTLWNLELSGYKSTIPDTAWAELATYAEPFMDDYFTPYLTVTAILSVAKTDWNKAKAAQAKLEAFVSRLISIPEKYHAWHDIALPVLAGCLAYMKGNNREAVALLAPVHMQTRAMGHSDEQRSVFSAIYQQAQALQLGANI